MSKSYRAIFTDRNGERLAADQFAAEDAVAAIDFADRRAPEAATRFMLCDGRGREIGEYPL